MDGGSATQGSEMSGTRLTNRSWTRSAGREGGGRQGEGTSALPAERAAQLSPVHLTQLKIPSGIVPGEGAWGSSVQATLPFRGVDGPGRIEPRLDQRLSRAAEAAAEEESSRVLVLSPSHPILILQQGLPSSLWHQEFRCCSSGCLDV